MGLTVEDSGQERWIFMDNKNLLHALPEEESKAVGPML
jgi:hypothetical protein